jgi:SnoaL-like domain
MTTVTWDSEDSDRRELTDLIIEFAWRVDHGLASSIHELVTDDIEMKLTNATLVGKASVVAWGTKRDTFERTTSHLMMNFRFRVARHDKVEVDSSSLIFRHDGPGKGAAVPWAVTEYHDVFTRVGNEWKFESRTSQDLFMSEGT